MHPTPHNHTPSEREITAFLTGPTLGSDSSVTFDPAPVESATRERRRDIYPSFRSTFPEGTISSKAAAPSMPSPIPIAISTQKGTK